MLVRAREIAQQSPVLSLEGTNLQLFGEATDKLQENTERLASLQPTAPEKLAVRDALYPIAFLRSLHALEEARRTFISSGKEGDYNEYARKQQEALKVGKAALSRFTTAFNAHTSDTYFPIVVVPGKITKEQTRFVLEQIRAGYEAAENAIHTERVCLKGAVGMCKTLDFAPLNIPLPKQKDEQTLTEVLDIYGHLVSPAPSPVIIGLDESVCLPDQKKVVYLRQTTKPGTLGIMWPTGDILLTPLPKETGTAPTRDWFKRQNATHLPYNPLIFYTCPNVGADIAKAQALFNLGSALGIASSASPILYEHEVISMLADTASFYEPGGDALQYLYGAYANGSAGLELVVFNIAHGLSSILAMHDAGIPVTINTDFLFSTYSGYYSLFLGYNKTAMSGSPAAYEPDPKNTFFTVFSYYSDSKNTLDYTVLRRDLEIFLQAHHSNL